MTKSQPMVVMDKCLLVTKIQQREREAFEDDY